MVFLADSTQESLSQWEFQDPKLLYPRLRWPVAKLLYPAAPLTAPTTGEFYQLIGGWANDFMTQDKIMDKMGMGQNLVPLVNIKIAGKWMFIPLKMVSIGIDS